MKKVHLKLRKLFTESFTFGSFENLEIEEKHIIEEYDTENIKDVCFFNV